MANDSDNPLNVEVLNARLSGYDKAMGLRFVSATADEVTAELTISGTHHQPYGLVHGGVYCGVIETLCSVGSAINALPLGKSAVGLENNTSFVKAARDGKLIARATPLTKGRKTQVWECEVRDEAGNLCAHGKVRTLLLDSGRKIAGEAVHVGGESDA